MSLPTRFNKIVSLTRFRYMPNMSPTICVDFFLIHPQLVKIKVVLVAFRQDIAPTQQPKSDIRSKTGATNLLCNALFTLMFPPHCPAIQYIQN